MLPTLSLDIDQLCRDFVGPKFRKAYQFGEQARNSGLPRECNLGQEFRTLSGDVLKVYKSAWEQGWDSLNIPAIFLQMEDKLKV